MKLRTFFGKLRDWILAFFVVLWCMAVGLAIIILPFAVVVGSVYLLGVLL